MGLQDSIKHTLCVSIDSKEDCTASLLGKISPSCSNGSVLKQIIANQTKILQELEEVKRNGDDLRRKMCETTVCSNSVTSSLMKFLNDIVTQIREDRIELIKEIDEDRLELLKRYKLETGNAKVKKKRGVTNSKNENPILQPASSDPEMEYQAVHPAAHTAYLEDLSTQAATSDSNKENQAMHPAASFGGLLRQTATSDAESENQEIHSAAPTAYFGDRAMQAATSDANSRNQGMHAASLNVKSEDSKKSESHSSAADTFLQLSSPISSSKAKRGDDTPAEPVTSSASIANRENDAGTMPTGSMPVIIKSIPVLYNSDLIPVCDSIPEKITTGNDFVYKSDEECDTVEKKAKTTVETEDLFGNIEDTRVNDAKNIYDGQSYYTPKKRRGRPAGALKKSVDLPPDIENHERKKQKPHRRCYYCGRSYLFLSRHLMTIHNKEELVANAMKAGSGKLRSKGLRRVMILGLNLENQERLRKGLDVICIRKQCATSSKVQCNRCKGIFNQSTLFRHKRRCVGKHDSFGPSFTSIENLKRGHTRNHTFNTFHPKFRKKILDTMHYDTIGREIRNNNILKVIANDEFEKLIGRIPDKQIQRRVCGHVRRVAAIGSRVNKNLKERGMEPIDIEQMFDVQRIHDVKSAVQQMCSKGEEGIRAIAKSNDSSIRKGAIALISYYRENENEVMKKQIGEFYSHYASPRRK